MVQVWIEFGPFMFNGWGPRKAYTFKIYDRALQRIALYIDLGFLATLKAGLFQRF